MTRLGRSIPSRLVGVGALLFAVSADARAQRTQLELRPKVGDTLRMRLDQVMEVSGGRRGSVMTPLVTTLRMFSRAIVESSTATSVQILAVTDSVDVSSSDAHASALTAQTERQLKGRQMRLRLAPDGTVGLIDNAGVPREVNDVVSVMPASFPREPVGVGETWTREMPIASGSTFGAPVGAVVRANFRLDSLSPASDLAFITMRGTVEPPAQVSVQRSMTGSVEGRIVVNRRRGWLAESRFQVLINTTVETLGEARAPMQFRTKITQHVRIFDKR